jgi:hypothetical protein
MRYVKAFIGILLIAFGLWVFSLIFTAEKPYVLKCAVFGSLSLLAGMANLKNWNKTGWFMRFDKAFDEKVFSYFKRTPAVEPVLETKTELRERIKKERIQSGTWYSTNEAPEVPGQIIEVPAESSDETGTAFTPEQMKEMLQRG